MNSRPSPDHLDRAEYSRAMALLDLSLLDLQAALDAHEKRGRWADCQTLERLEGEMRRLAAQVRAS